MIMAAPAAIEATLACLDSEGQITIQDNRVQSLGRSCLRTRASLLTNINLMPKSFRIEINENIITNIYNNKF